MNRLAFLFAFCFAFGSLGIQWIAAQDAPVAARPPVPAQMPRTTTVPTSTPQAANKPATPSRSVQPAASGKSANRTAQEPVQTKLVRIYRGDGYFDIALAEKLRPMLTKNSSEPPPSNNRSTPVDWLRAIVGGGDNSQKSVNQKTVAETGRP